MASTPKQNQAIIARSLYRSVLRTARPFIESPTLHCLLLHRSDQPPTDTYTQCVHHVMNGRSYHFPKYHQECHGRLENSIRQNFRTRKDIMVGFRALRELRSKLDLLYSIEASLEKESPRASAEIRGVRLTDEIRPGTFLLAHPLMTGYFARSVILLLDTATEGSDSHYGAYGLVINRPCQRSENSQTFNFSEVIHPLPTTLHRAFGDLPAQEGGPVQMAVQLLYTTDSSPDSAKEIGGIRLPSCTENEKIVYYKGNPLKAAANPPGQVGVFVGASCWTFGQLENEIAQGCWKTFVAPPTLAFLDEQEHQGSDLWGALLDACGETELARLSRHLTPEDCPPCDLTV